MASTDGRPIPIKNTAYRVTFPIFDADGDLVTGATGLDSEVSKDGGTFADCTNEATEIATSSGMYYLDLTSTEMNADTVAVIVKTTSSGAKTTPLVMYPQEAGDIKVDVETISGDSAAADNAEAFFDGTGYAGTNNVIPTVTTATNVTTVNGLAANVITAASIATGAIDADAIADGAIDAGAIAADAITAAKIADGAIDAGTFAAGAITASAIAADAIGASELAADAVAEIQAAVAAGAVASVTGAVGSVTGNVGGNVAGSVGSVASGGISSASFAAGAITASAIAADAIGASELAADAVTEIQSGLATAAALAVVDGIVDDILVDTGTTLQAELDGIQADTEDIQSRLPAALASGNIKADVLAINGSTAAAARLALSAANMIPGTVDTTAFTATTTILESDDITEATADHYNGRLILFTSGALIGQVSEITDYALNGGRGRFTYTALTEAPANNDTFLLV